MFQPIVTAHASNSRHPESLWCDMARCASRVSLGAHCLNAGPRQCSPLRVGAVLLPSVIRPTTRSAHALYHADSPLELLDPIVRPAEEGADCCGR